MSVFKNIKTEMFVDNTEYVLCLMLCWCSQDLRHVRRPKRRLSADCNESVASQSNMADFHLSETTSSEHLASTVSDDAAAAADDDDEDDDDDDDSVDDR